METESVKGAHKTTQSSSDFEIVKGQEVVKSQLCNDRESSTISMRAAEIFWEAPLHRPAEPHRSSSRKLPNFLGSPSLRFLVFFYFMMPTSHLI